eukprot:gb/GEZN01005873.1/.p1 GENE.gb/GEZN01005873.1/~~gb/GEZN01005873.1/.p1  ORF type:complete len:439 (+),score=23.05 gb/GEZN01005873.1/:95-1411(+)
MTLHLIGILFLASRVNAHARLTSPAPRPYQWSGGYNAPTYTCLGPAFGTPVDSMRCHGVGYSAGGVVHTIKAGDVLDMTWITEANHPGDCSVWISYDSDVTSPGNWVRIAEIPGCLKLDASVSPATGPNNYQLRVPSYLPPCEHCVMRWEWYTVQQVSNVEFYVNCFDVKIESDPACVAPAPSETTAIATISYLGACPFQEIDVYNPTYAANVFGKHVMRGPAVWVPNNPNCNAGTTPTTGAPPTATSTTTATMPTTTSALSTTTTTPTATTALSSSTSTANPRSCTVILKLWDGCLSTPSCCPSGASCYQQNQWYAQCLLIGACPTSGWTCTVLGQGTGGQVTTTTSAPRVSTTTLAPQITSTTSVPSSCSIWQNCKATPNCCPTGTNCYKQHQWYAQCRPSCPPDWSCEILGFGGGGGSGTGRRLLQAIPRGPGSL